MNSWQIKLLSAIGIIALITGLLLIIKYQRDIINKQTQIQNSLIDMKKLPDSITRDQVQYATADDLNKLANSLNIKLDPIKNDLASLKASVTGIQTITVNSSGENKTNVASTFTTPRTDPIPTNISSDPYGYQKNAQNLTLNETYGKIEVPEGNVSFSAWQQNPWSVNIYPKKYNVINVLGTDENGKNYVYSKFSITSDGKTYDIDVNDAKMVEELPEAKFRFSPRLFFGVSAGTLIAKPEFEFVPNLELILFNRGISNVYPEWLFLGIGGGLNFYNKKFQIMISPFSYNVGQYIPFMKNLYLTTDISIDAHGQFSILGGLKVGL